MLATQLKYDLLMFSRELFYLVFTIIVPPVTYLFMGQLFGDQTYAGNLKLCRNVYTIIHLTHHIRRHLFRFRFRSSDESHNRRRKTHQSFTCIEKNAATFSILKSIIITSIGFFLVYLIGMLAYDLSFEPIRFLSAYGFFIILNAVLLVISSAIYSLFKSMNAALVFSIVIFQVVMFTGGFTMPISMMPKFVQVIADVNPLYHMNNLFIAVWNGQLTFNNSTLISIGYISGLSNHRIDYHPLFK